MHTLYGARGSGSAAVEVGLIRAAVAYRTVDAASWKASPGRDELARLNPLLQIPTLVLPSGAVLTESAAILLHLGLACPTSGLLPDEVERRSQVIRGLVYIAANCYAAIGICDFPDRWCQGADADDSLKERIRAGAKARGHHHWDAFADSFPATPFLSGESPGALDILAAVVSKWAGARAHLRASRPAFHAALGRIESDPVVAAVFARHWPG